MTADECLRLARDAAAGLAALAADGWVHRNISPSSVLFTADGVAKLSDFALYRSPRSEGDQSVTATAAGFGDLAYQSPERVNGDKNLTVASDLYALGAVLFEAATGRPAYSPDLSLLDLCRNVCEGPVPSASQFAPDLPAELTELIRRAMAKNPADRFADVPEFLDALGQIGVESCPRTAPARPRS